MEIKLEGQWRGYFELGPDYGSAEGEITTFMLFIEKENNGQFIGKSVDFDGIGENNNAADIHGFLQSEFISFIKQYPFLFEVNEKKEAVFSKKKTIRKYIMKEIMILNSKGLQVTGRWLLMPLNHQKIV